MDWSMVESALALCEQNTARVQGFAGFRLKKNPCYQPALLGSPYGCRSAEKTTYLEGRSGGGTTDRKSVV